MTIKFGAAAWPFQWGPPYEQCIRRIAALGFEATELIAWNERYIDEYYTKDVVARLRTELAQSGLVLSQFVYTPKGLAHPDPAIRESAIASWQKAVSVAAEFGTGLICAVSDGPFSFGRDIVPYITDRHFSQTFETRGIGRGLDWSGNYAAYVEALGRCADICARAGLVMTLEPHPARYVANHDGALRLLGDVGSAALGINFDPSHTYPAGDFPDVSIYRLGSHVRHVHVSDNDGTSNVHWRPGKGKIGWSGVFGALHDIGYDGVVSIELEHVPGAANGEVDDPPGGPAATASDAFVDETMAGLGYLKAEYAAAIERRRGNGF